MSSGESGTRSAGSVVPGQRGGDEREPAHGDRARERAADGRPSGEQPVDDSAPPPQGSTGDSRPGRSRARWQDLSRSALRDEPAPSAEELGDEDYWSYLRGNQVPPTLEDDAGQRDSRAAVGPRTWEAAPQAEPAESIVEPARPVAEPIQPVAAPAESIVEPIQPVAAPAESIVEPIQPIEEPIRPVAEPALPTTGAAASTADTVAPTTAAADPVTGPQPVRDVEPSPAWPALIRPNRRARVRPGTAQPVALTVLVALGWLAVVAYGVFRLDLLWSLGALVAGAGALALALRGRSVIGLVPVLVGAAAWGMATGSQVPASLSDLVGDLRLIGWNALYAVPLLVAYGFATWLDAAGSARDRVRAVLGDRRWWGAADVPDAEPGIAELEAIPSARFFQLTTGSCPHLVTAGRRVALIRSTVWPRGAYTVAETGEVQRNGRIFVHGADDLRGAVADAGAWTERLGSAASTVTGFLVVHPSSDRPGDLVDIDVAATGGVRVITAKEFVAVAGDFLAAEPYRLDVALTERLGERLPIFEPEA